MTKYQLTIIFEDIDTLMATTQAVADVTDKKKTTANTSTDDDAPAEETTARKGRAGKTTNGKTADGNGKPAGVREKALQICRDLLEFGDESVKKGLKALRDEFEVKKLSDVPLEAAEQFLAKAQKLKEKFDV